MRSEQCVRWSVVCASLLAAGVVASPWQQYGHDPFRSGNSHTAVGLSQSANAWVFSQAGPVLSAPVVDSQYNAYFGSEDSHVYSISIVNGQLNWRTNLNGPVPSSPALSLDEVQLYVGSRNGLYSLNTTSGRNMWYRSLNGGVSGGPAVDSLGNIYVVADSGLFLCYTAFGIEVWRSALLAQGASPALLENYVFGWWQFNLVFLTSQAWDAVVAYNISNGKVIWQTQVPQLTNVTDVTIANPDWFGGDGAVVYSNDYILYALHTTPSFQNKVIWTWSAGTGPLQQVGSPVAIGDDGSVFWGAPNNTFVSLSSSGQYQWSVNTDSVVQSKPALGAGFVWFISTKGTLYCADENSGYVYWQSVLSPTTTNLALTDNGLLLVASSGDGSVYGVGSFVNPSPSPTPAASPSVHVSIHATRTRAPTINNNMPGGTVAGIVIAVLLGVGAIGGLVYYKFFKVRMGYSAPASSGGFSGPFGGSSSAGAAASSYGGTSAGAYQKADL